MICSFQGAREDLMRRIIGSMDGSVAVIKASQISGLLAASPQKGTFISSDHLSI